MMEKNFGDFKFLKHSPEKSKFEESQLQRQSLNSMNQFYQWNLKRMERETNHYMKQNKISRLDRMSLTVRFSQIEEAKIRMQSNVKTIEEIRRLFYKNFQYNIQDLDPKTGFFKRSVIDKYKFQYIIGQQIEQFDEEDVFHMANLIKSGNVLESVGTFIFFSHILCIILFFRKKAHLNGMLTIRRPTTSIES